jgi:hypothetical protein
MAELAELSSDLYVQSPIGVRLPGLAELCADPLAMLVALPFADRHTVHVGLQRPAALGVEFGNGDETQLTAFAPVSPLVPKPAMGGLPFSMPPLPVSRRRDPVLYARPSDFILRPFTAEDVARANEHVLAIADHAPKERIHEPGQHQAPKKRRIESPAPSASSESPPSPGSAPEVRDLYPCSAKASRLWHERGLPLVLLRTDTIAGQHRPIYMYLTAPTDAQMLALLKTNKLGIQLTVRALTFEVEHVLYGSSKKRARIRLILNPLIGKRPTVLGTQALPVQAKLEVQANGRVVCTRWLLIDHAHRGVAGTQLTIGV